MTHDPAIATAADYADALLTARRAKNALLLIVLLCLLIQLAVFFATKYTGWVFPLTDMKSPAATTMPLSIAPLSTSQVTTANWNDLMHYFIGLTDFLGFAMTIAMALVLCVIVKIMLVGRLIGVARVTSALVWSFVVLVLLFPWQAFLAYQPFTSRTFMLPGVLYTWTELLDRVTMGTRNNHPDMNVMILHWTRFVAWPVVAVIILLAIHVKSNRGLRQALGEDVLNDGNVGAT